MTHGLNRRLAFAGFVALTANIAGRVAAQDARGLDGTWGGSRDGVTAQVIVVGASVIGFFWREDYLDAGKPTVSADGLGLSFNFQGGSASLTRTGERTATLEVREGESVIRLDLQRD